MSKTVLIVEDEPNIVESLAFLLQRDGFTVRTISDGAAAMAELVQTAPDVVILDVMLPNVSGFDILSSIRGHDRFARLPVMMLTAKGQRRDRDRAEELGADIFVTKPFSNTEIVAEVRRLAERVA
ncbi:MAG: response regulator [Pseudomonadota bacterium]